MSESTLLALLGVAFVAIAILGGVIVKQKQTINDFRHPKYGFLGKKLSVYLLGVLTFGVGSIILYPAENKIDTSVSVSETQPSIDLEIIYNMLDSENRTYEFILIPKINGVDWENEISNFEIVWEVNGVLNSEVISKNNPGGILVRLDSGKNIIKASLTYLDQSYIETLEIDI